MSGRSLIDYIRDVSQAIGEADLLLEAVPSDPASHSLDRAKRLRTLHDLQGLLARIEGLLTLSTGVEVGDEDRRVLARLSDARDRLSTLVGDYAEESEFDRDMEVMFREDAELFRRLA